MAPATETVPAGYVAGQFPAFAVTVDLVVLTVREGALCALLIQRGEQPHLGRSALPGGFVRVDEDLDVAARRELSEETGLARLPVHLEQLATYGAVGRDPRMRVVSVAYLALAPDLPPPQAGGDAAAAAWVPVSQVLSESSADPGLSAQHFSAQGRPAPSRSVASRTVAPRPVSAESVPPGQWASESAPSAGVCPPGPAALAFDHVGILADGVERARAKLEYSPLAAAFCPAEFTVGELRRVYEAVWGVTLDARNFHRKVTGTAGFLLPVGRATVRQGGRPAQLFQLGPATLLNPPMLRPA